MRPSLLPAFFFHLLLLLPSLLFAEGPVTAEEPINITADRLEHRKDQDLFVGEGSVVITQGPVKLTADRMTYYRATKKVKAEGRVVFFDGQRTLTGTRGEIDLTTRVGSVYGADLFIKEDNYRLQGAVMRREAEDRYRVDEASFTTCDLPADGSPAWRFRAKRVRVRMDKYLSASHLIFYVRDVPVFYVPYLILPIVKPRQTGFLIPRIGYNTADGFTLREGFFWAIAPNQDVTITADYRSERGVGGELEYRYLLSRVSGGSLRTTYFFDQDRESGRLETFYTHRQQFTERLRFLTDLHFVNEKNFFRELSDVTEERAQRKIESNAILSQRWDASFLYLLARYTQDLTATSKITPQKLPEVGYNLPALRMGTLPLFLSLDAVATNFFLQEERPDLGRVRAQRADLFPKLALRLEPIRGLVLTPSAGFRETIYSRRISDDDVPAFRGVYVVGGEAHARIVRLYGKSVLHQIEPRVMYEYVPQRGQDDLPTFDELDRLPRKKLLTYSLTNRLTKNREILTLKATQSYRGESGQGESGRRFSDLRGEMTLTPLPPLSLDVDSFYDPYQGRVVSVNTDLRFVGSAFWAFSVGQRYTQQGPRARRGDIFNPLSLGETEDVPADIRFYTTTLVLHPTRQMTLAGKGFYDQERGLFHEADAGVQYEGQCGCWAATVTFIHFPEKDQVTFLITLRGLGSSGDTQAFDRRFQP